MRRFKIITCLSVFLLSLSGCSAINKKLNVQNDNFLEEFAEGAVEKYFNLPPGFLDFTPEED